MVHNNLEHVPVSLATGEDRLSHDALESGYRLRWSADDRASVSAKYRQLLTGLEVVLAEAARRIEAAPGDWLPGFGEVLEGVVLYATAAKQPVDSWYCANVWRDSCSGQRFAEIVLNADTLNRSPEMVLAATIHELVHAYAEATDRKVTSRRGTYHNAVFADLAMKAGLNVRRHSVHGHVTAGISPLGARLYGDLLEPLDSLLRLHRDPDPDDDPDPDGTLGASGAASEPQEEEATHSRYVMAQCGCTNDRGRPIVIRVARGNWAEDTIWCRRCDRTFAA